MGLFAAQEETVYFFTLKDLQRFIDEAVEQGASPTQTRVRFICENQEVTVMELGLKAV